MLFRSQLRHIVLSDRSHSLVCLWSNSRTLTHYKAIAPHLSSSYPDYLSPVWDEDTQRAVVWQRLREHRKLASQGLKKINERYKALRQEQQTQAESRHEPSSRDSRLHGLPPVRAVPEVLPSWRPWFRTPPCLWCPSRRR